MAPRLAALVLAAAATTTATNAQRRAASPLPMGLVTLTSPAGDVALRHCYYQAFAAPPEAGSADFQFTVVDALSGAPGDVSLRSYNYPTQYLALIGAVNGATEGTRLGITASPAASDASFTPVAGLSDPTLVSLRVAGGTFAGLYVGRAPAGTLSGQCAADYAAPSSDVLLVDGAGGGDGAPATWAVLAGGVDPVTNFTLGGLSFGLRNKTGTIAVLHDAGDDSGFSFTPDDSGRLRANFHHLGDVTLKVRPAAGGSGWATVTTAASTAEAPRVAPTVPGAFWASDVSALLATPAAPGLVVTRQYTAPADGGGIVLHTVVTNGGSAAIEIGGFGTSIVTNNNWNGLTLDQNAATCSLLEPYVGGDAGFAKATRITGSGPVLMVAPHAASCGLAGLPAGATVAYCGSPLQVWRPLREDATPGVGVAFEGLYEWTAVTGGWAADEWAGAPAQWTAPNNVTLPPGATAVFPLRLWTTPSQATTEAALVGAGQPLARGVPGFVLSADTTAAMLLLTPPVGGAIAGVTVEPAGALAVAPAAAIPPAADGTRAYSVTPAGGGGVTGRVRVTVAHTLPASSGGGTIFHVVNYFLTPPTAALLGTYSAFTASRAWFNASDAFGRTYSVMGWDAEAGAQVLQEGRVFVAGLSDEAGAGANVGYAVHAAYSTADVTAAALVATYVNRTLNGQKRDGNGTLVSVQDPVSLGIRAAMFWGTPTDRMPGYNYTVCMVNPTWACWDEPRGETQWRSYNYVHQIMTYLAMYRLATYYDRLAPAVAAAAAASGGGLSPLAPAGWYLNKSALTLLAMGTLGSYNGVGLMAADVTYAGVLDALAEEAAADPSSPYDWAGLFSQCDALQRSRTKTFVNTDFPYGSEMPWDSTGQPEVFRFSTRYAADFAPASYRTSNLTVAAVLAYTPWDVALWAYHGSSRRYFDDGVNGKWAYWGTERALHHYGSGINSGVLLRTYRMYPNNTLALRAGYAASLGPLTTIDPSTGAPSMNFHSDPTLVGLRDPYSADWGVGFTVAAEGWGCWLHRQDAAYGGPLAGTVTGYGCDAATDAGTGVVNATLRDAYRRLAFIGPLGLELRSRNAPIAYVAWDASKGTVTVGFDPAPGAAGLFSAVALEVNTPPVLPVHRVASWGWVQPSTPPASMRGAYALAPTTATVVLSYVPPPTA